MEAKRVVVVGCGGMGRNWIKTVLAQPRCRLVGVVDLRREAAEAAAKEAGLPAAAAFTAVDEAIRALRPDFICDITIPEAHRPTSEAALALGIPVLGEKPLADTLESGRAMRDAAERAGKLLMTSQSRRYDDKHRALRGAIRSGAIGPITTVCCDFFIGAHFGGFRETMSSPLILDMAIHHFDLLRFFTGLDAEAVYAREFHPAESWYQGAVAASVIFELSGGAVFTYRGSWCAEGCHTSWNGDWRVVGTRGTLLYAGDAFPSGQRVKEGGKAGFHRELEPVAVAADPSPANGIGGALLEFLDALDGKGAPQGEVHDNLKSLAMVHAAVASSRAVARIAVDAA